MTSSTVTIMLCVQIFSKYIIAGSSVRSIAADFTLSFPETSCCPFVVLVLTSMSKVLHNKTCVECSNKSKRSIEYCYLTLD